MIGTTAALITMGAISAGTKVGGAIMEGRAAGRASKAQQQAAQQSNAVNQQMYGNAMQMTQPFRNAGTQSMGLLGSLMLPQGQPGAYRPGMPIPGAPPLQQGPPQAVPRPGMAQLGGAMMGGQRPMGAPPMQGPPPGFAGGMAPGGQQMRPMPPQNPWAMAGGFGPRY